MADEPAQNLGTVWALSQSIAFQGVDFATAWSILQEANLSTRDMFQATYRLGAEAARKNVYLQAQDDDYVPTAEAIVDSPITYQANFAYKVQIEGTLLGTEESGLVMTTVLSNHPITKGDALTSALADVILDPEQYGITPLGGMVVQVEASGAFDITSTRNVASLGVLGLA
jgi:hypothetical protein